MRSDVRPGAAVGCFFPMDDSSTGPAGGVHVVSTDSAERARLISSVRACGLPYCRSAAGAELILHGGGGTSPADLEERRRKHPGRCFALVGDRLPAALLDAAARAGCLALLPDASPSRRFAVEVRSTFEAARELTRLRRWAVEIDEAPPAELIEEPDAALEADNAPPRDPIVDRDLARRLTEACRQGDFDLFYQPKVNAGNRAVVGFEALIRWTDAELGPISPEVFIPMAEAQGLITGIGEWCIHEACAHAARWVAEGLVPGRVAVNASPVQFQQPGFARRIIDVVRGAGLEPDHFELEITEGCLLESDEAIATLSELVDAGIHVAIDDFGTGYSSLQYLRRLPIHCLKIDRVFVTDLETDPSARSLVAAIISLAWNLGLRVVAEGVENEYQWRFLADHGCDEIQGFHFSPPLAAEAAASLLKQERVRAESD